MKKNLLTQTLLYLNQTPDKNNSLLRKKIKTLISRLDENSSRPTDLKPEEVIQMAKTIILSPKRIQGKLIANLKISLYRFLSGFKKIKP